MYSPTNDYITEQYPKDVQEVIAEAFPQLKKHYSALAVHFLKTPKDRWNISTLEYPCRTYIVPFDLTVTFGGRTFSGDDFFSKNFLKNLAAEFQKEEDIPFPWEEDERLSTFLMEQRNILHHSLAHPKLFYAFLPPNKPADRFVGRTLGMDDSLLDMYQAMHNLNIPTSILLQHYRDVVRSSIIMRIFKNPEYVSKVMCITAFKWHEATREAKAYKGNSSDIEELFLSKVQETARYTAIIRVTTKIKGGKEYKNWNYNSMSGYLIITTDDGEMQDSVFVLSFVIQFGPVHQLSIFLAHLFSTRYNVPQFLFCGLRLYLQFFELGGGLVNQAVQKVSIKTAGALNDFQRFGP